MRDRVGNRSGVLIIVAPRRSRRRTPVAVVCFVVEFSATTTSRAGLSSSSSRCFGIECPVCGVEAVGSAYCRSFRAFLPLLELHFLIPALQQC
jgi:hypothetical protein